MRDVHVDSDLSAYLDGELAPAERAPVDAHLASCARCRQRLGELRATAALIAALPTPSPSHSLVPVVAQRWSWLRPVRALSAIATGAFLFAFLLTAVGRGGSGLGGGDESTAIFGGSGATTAA
ncbi:MAG: zf-HC2 domain-containing protein, partial [Chloroflexota bacterium]|nr:zf-HC2 domain-containing protein [Chloroflexota bacterium]